MKYSDLKTSIVEQFKTTNQIGFLLLGQPGGGKSALARDIGRDLGFDTVS